MSPVDSSSVKSKLRAGATVCLLTAITWLVFAQVARFGFIVIDDSEYVADNSHVSRASVRNIVWAWTTQFSANWHPLTWLSLTLDAHLFGKHPAAFHVTNLVLHTANVLLLFGALRALTAAHWRSACVAALFAVHPMHVESVAWISERKDVLSTCFGFCALWMYARYVRHPSWRTYAAVLVCLVLSLLAKQMLVTLPCVFLLLDAWPLGRTGEVSWRRLIIEKLPFLLVSALGCVAVIVAQRSAGGVKDLQAFPLASRLGNAVTAYAIYLFKTVWPLKLAAFYPYPESPSFLLEVLPAALLLTVITAAAVVWRRRRPWLLVGWLWFLGMLVPVIGLIQVGYQHLADRYSYVPSVGLFIAVTWAAAEWARGRTWRTVMAPTVAILAIVLCLVQARRQTSYWSDSLTLVEHARAVTPPNQFCEIALGNALLQAGQGDRARRQYERTVALWPTSTGALTSLGSYYLGAGRAEQAVPVFRRVIELAPQRVGARLNLGRALAVLQQNDAALDEFQSALNLTSVGTESYEASDIAAVHIEIGLLLRATGRSDEALREFRRATEVAPDSLDALTSLGAGLVGVGRVDEAIACYRRALDCDPEFVPAMIDLGIVRHNQGRLDEALAQLEHAWRLEPQNETVQYWLTLAYVNLARRRAAAGNGPLALAALESARGVSPDSFIVHYTFAGVLASQGRNRDAIDYYRLALASRPDLAEVHFELGLQLEQIDQRDQAAQEYREAVRLNPEFAPAVDALRRVTGK